MEIRVLRYFLTVVREESITKASEVLHITQPTLSRQLSQMEEEVGVKLFERGSRRITLTNEGILLRRRAEEILQLVDKIEGAIPFWDPSKITHRPLSPALTATSVLAWKRGQPFGLAATKFIEHIRCLLSMGRP